MLSKKHFVKFLVFALDPDFSAGAAGEEPCFDCFEVEALLGVLLDELWAESGFDFLVKDLPWFEPFGDLGDFGRPCLFPEFDPLGD